MNNLCEPRDLARLIPVFERKLGLFEFVISLQTTLIKEFLLLSRICVISSNNF